MGMLERRVSAKKEIEGVPIEYDGFRVGIARSGGSNKKYLAYMEKLTASKRDALVKGFVSNETALEWRRLSLAHVLITSWEVKRDGKWIEGMDDFISGDAVKVLQFTPENVYAVVSNLEFHDYFTDFWKMSEDARIYRENAESTDLGNS